MLTPKQVSVFGAFLMQPYRELTYREVKEYCREKSNSAIQKSLSKFLKEGLVTRRQVGNIMLYKAELGNWNVFSYFGILSAERLPKTARLCLKIVKEEISRISFASLVVFGSYAEGRQTEKSDLDLAVFVGNDRDKKECKLLLKSAELKCVLPLDAQVFTKGELLEMLKDRQENLGKEIARKHLALQNPEIFYSALEEGIKNGFSIVP